jgi:anaerobic C4-dicarboxylate transporter
MKRINKGIIGVSVIILIMAMVGASLMLNTYKLDSKEINTDSLTYKIGASLLLVSGVSILASTVFCFYYVIYPNDEKED